jgi:hypothetical protein
MRPLITLPIILDQAVSYCSYHFGSCCRLLFTLFWIRPLVTLPIILDQAVSWRGHVLFTLSLRIVMSNFVSYDMTLRSLFSVVMSVTILA